MISDTCDHLKGGNTPTQPLIFAVMTEQCEINPMSLKLDVLLTKNNVFVITYFQALKEKEKM